MAQEAQTQKAICDYLAARRHFYTRINTTGVYDAKRGVWRKPSVHNKAGMSDILVVHVGVPYFLECKGKGQQSEDQLRFQREVEKAGACYAIVRSIDDVRQLGL
jgi:hypothetical protein